MFCMKCNKNVIDCTCTDIDERLGKLRKNPVLSLAVESNLSERRIKEGDIVTGHNGQKWKVGEEIKRTEKS